MILEANPDERVGDRNAFPAANRRSRRPDNELMSTDEESKFDL